MRKLGGWLSGLVLMLVFITGIIFSYFNTDPVSLAFGNWQTATRPVSVWLIGAFVVGGALGLLLGLGLFRQMRLRAEIRRLNKELRDSTREVKKLRALSLRDLD